MNTFSLVLSALLTLTLIVLIAPGIFRLNRGRVLQNTALWLAIALGLALVYQTFGPGKNQAQNIASPAEEAVSGSDSDKPAAGAGEGEQGFTPPRE